MVTIMNNSAKVYVKLTLKPTLELIHTLVFGAARSGKSTYAEQLAATKQRKVVYIATATADVSRTNSKMQKRIALHKSQRPAHCGRPWSNR